MRIINVIVFLLRIIIIYCIFLSNNNGILTTYDSKGYVDSALSILELKSFAVSPQQPEEPQLYRTPGYPLFIAAIYFLFGKNNLILNISQNILSLISILVIAHLCYTLLSKLNYITIFTLLVLDIFSVVMSNFLLSEILF